MKQSRSAQYLKGRSINGYDGKIVDITVTPTNQRRVYFDNGKSVILSKQALTTALHNTIAQNQRIEMEANRTYHEDGSVSQPVKGLKRGEVRRYKNVSRADAALTRIYGNK